MCTYTFFILFISQTHIKAQTLSDSGGRQHDNNDAVVVLFLLAARKKGGGEGLLAAMAERSGDCGCFVCVLLCCG